MTLNNSRQKINDCLGNPIEIGIAVTWRVVDTAKAVFNVDNYKEYLVSPVRRCFDAISYGSILMTQPLMSIQPETGRQTKEAFAAPARS